MLSGIDSSATNDAAASVRDAERELAVVKQEHAEAIKTMQQAHAEVVAAAYQTGCAPRASWALSRE